MDIIPSFPHRVKLGLDGEPISNRTLLTEYELQQLQAYEWLEQQGPRGNLRFNAFLEVFGDTTVGASNQTLGRRLRRLKQRAAALQVTLRGRRLPEDLEDRLKKALMKWRQFRAPPGQKQKRT